MCKSFVTKFASCALILGIVLCFAFCLAFYGFSTTSGVAFADEYSVIAVGDNITQLYIDTSVTPDMSPYSSMVDGDFIILVGSTSVIESLSGVVLFKSDGILQMKAGGTGDLAFTLWTSDTGWNATDVNEYMSVFVEYPEDVCFTVSTLDNNQTIGFGWGMFLAKQNAFYKYVPVPPTPYDIGSQIVEIIVGGIGGIASGVGEGLSDMASNLFMAPDGESLSTFGVLIVCFAGISLAVGLSRWVVNFVTSLGSSNR